MKPRPRRSACAASPELRLPLPSNFGLQLALELPLRAPGSGQRRRDTAFAVQKPLVLITRRLALAPREVLGTGIDVDQHDDESVLPRAELLRRVHGAGALLPTLADRVDGELLDAAPRLRVVANHAVGYDNVDVAACTARGVWVTNTPDVLTDSTADLAWALGVLRTKASVIAGDLCGAYSPPVYARAFQRFAGWWDHPKLPGADLIVAQNTNRLALQVVWPALTGA